MHITYIIKCCEFQLNIHNLKQQALDIPDTDYPTTIKISSSEFVSLCRDFTSLSDCVKIEVKEEKWTFSVTFKTGSGKYTLKNNNDERIEDQFSIVN